MSNIFVKLEYLKWFKLIGIEYYFSKKKNTHISLFKRIETDSNKLNFNEVNTNTIINNDKTKKRLKINKIKTLANSANSLNELKEIVINFNGCSLKHFALNTVFADGNPKAEIMLLGEAPGAKEDELSIPFCGESGTLLDLMLSTINLSRKENIYITNSVFWRPPANRKPTKEEINICRPFLEKHIALINPKLLICIGSTAVSALLGEDVNLNKAREKKHFYKNSYLVKPIITLALFHPAYLLRQPSKKKDTWFDLIRIQKHIEDNIKQE